MHKRLTKPPSVTVYILSTPCGHKISNYIIIKNRQNFGVVRLLLNIADTHLDLTLQISSEIYVVYKKTSVKNLCTAK